MSAEKIIQQCEEIKEMLLAKNKAYGDSALNPVRVFSKADSVEQIRVRLDDKLSRLKRGNEFDGDDTIKDLIGYLILFRIASESEEKPKACHEILDSSISKMLVKASEALAKEKAINTDFDSGLSDGGYTKGGYVEPADEIEECIKGAKLYANTET